MMPELEQDELHLALMLLIARNMIECEEETQLLRDAGCSDEEIKACLRSVPVGD
jgi:hypothetical protein